jgi:hypothetical protein
MSSAPDIIPTRGPDFRAMPSPSESPTISQADKKITQVATPPITELGEKEGVSQEKNIGAVSRYEVPTEVLNKIKQDTTLGGYNTKLTEIEVKVLVVQDQLDHLLGERGEIRRQKNDCNVKLNENKEFLKQAREMLETITDDPEERAEYQGYVSSYEKNVKEFEERLEKILVVEKEFEEKNDAKIKELRIEHEDLKKNYGDLIKKKAEYVKENYTDFPVLAMQKPATILKDTLFYHAMKMTTLSRILSVGVSPFSEYKTPTFFSPSFIFKTTGFVGDEMGQQGTGFSRDRATYLGKEKPYAFGFKLCDDVEGSAIPSVTELETLGFSHNQIDVGFGQLQSSSPFLQHSGLPPADTEFIFLEMDGKLQLKELITGGDTENPTTKEISNYSDLENEWGLLFGHKPPIISGQFVPLPGQPILDDKTLESKKIYNPSPEILKLPEDKQKIVKDQCLKDYHEALEVYERAVGQAALHNVNAKGFAAEMCRRTRETLKVYNQIMEKKFPVTKRISKLEEKIQKRPLIEALRKDIESGNKPFLMTRSEIQVMEARAETQGLEDLKREVEEKGLKPRALTEQENKFLDQLKTMKDHNRSWYSAELMEKMRWISAYGTEAESAGSVGYLLSSIDTAIQEGNLREQMTLQHTAYKYLLTAFASDPTIVSEINDELRKLPEGQAFQLDEEMIGRERKAGALAKQLDIVSAVRERGERKELLPPTHTKEEYSAYIKRRESRPKISEVPEMTEREKRAALEDYQIKRTLGPDADRDKLSLMEEGVYEEPGEKSGDRRVQWISGSELYTIKTGSQFALETKYLGDMPLRTGPSGSGDFDLHFARYLGVDDEKSLKDGVLALAGWMIPAKDHSLHEILLVGAEHLDSAGYKHSPLARYRDSLLNGSLEVYENFSDDPKFTKDLSNILSDEGRMKPGYYLSQEHQEVVARNHRFI